MRKLKLELDELAVESFATDKAEDGKGTVHGFISYLCSEHDQCWSVGHSCEAITCGEFTCAVSCGDCTAYYCG